MWTLRLALLVAAGVAPAAASRLRSAHGFESSAAPAVGGTTSSASNGTQNATKWTWPMSIYPMPAAPPWRLPAEDPAWPRDQNRLRKFRLDRTEAEYSEELRRLSVDDRPDTVTWKANATDFHPFDGTGRSSIWWAVCHTFNSSLANLTNGTNGANGTNGTNSSNRSALDGWALVNETYCAQQDLLAGNFTNSTAAAAACGKNCSAIQDLGCSGKEFRLCRIGAKQQTSKVGTCLRMRSRRGPQETEFWREFCARKAVPFRLLFPGRRCAAGKVLQGPLTDVACAEKVGADASCSKFFDMRMATPPPAAVAPECRCLPKGSNCEAAADPERDVFVLA